MRFDLEQFLALTMALGTAGAVGVAVYSSQDAAPAPHADAATAEPAEEEPFPEAEDDPAPTTMAASTPSPVPTPIPALDAAPDELDAAPGPQVETMSW